ncbi:MAG: hypothetical protein HQK57_07525 [Deltaproteobacteria bacterium]|nr:hypothetical protein [Deltaproteobacteria bacterium]MBF0508759.1 hypothetical protein [Deltaproteobacteria bacterium]MBF0524855.1 hypothetical protein [Deltaproteobacteria bacterium]
MPTKTFEQVKGSEFPAGLLEKFGFFPDQIFNITFEVVEKDAGKVHSEEARDSIEESVISLQLAMRGMEDDDEPEYTLADLKERWN